MLAQLHHTGTPLPRPRGLTLDAAARTAAVTALALAALCAVAAARWTATAHAEAEAREARALAASFAGWKPFAAQPALDVTRGLPVAVAPPPPAVIERDFTRLTAVDAQTLDAGDFRIRLTDVPAPPAGEQCRRLDGVSEPCAVRATTRLDLLVKWRVTTCRYTMESPSLAVGACRVGSASLASRLAAPAVPPAAGVRNES
ncbi:hypothetical protein GCM10007036_20360 [Alsobacter metallidurans]|uniref:Uncharacterized protein n=1 Tax=Alsobacter metallidurans TaxID=340221 RepID=A0A917I7H6_9HYPH|nr:hypothetical protein [Alsobacter metallidurans]GGH18299.1 hypothetical protein GCM10007036_20360 [Alsobacter metallidurans]